MSWTLQILDGTRPRSSRLKHDIARASASCTHGLGCRRATLSVRICLFCCLVSLGKPPCSANHQMYFLVYFQEGPWSSKPEAIHMLTKLPSSKSQVRCRLAEYLVKSWSNSISSGVAFVTWSKVLELYDYFSGSWVADALLRQMQNNQSCRANLQDCF